MSPRTMILRRLNFYNYGVGRFFKLTATDIIIVFGRLGCEVCCAFGVCV
ncbi:hypothetical protein HRbin03_00197 [archaeon HR03]|nr:hypothetical protein HRbin03_00197 [archaeon HR03]